MPTLYECSSLATVSLEDVIKDHKAELLTGDVCRISIRRDHIFEDALVAICNKDWDKKLKALLLKSIEKNTSLLDGSHNRRVLRHNATAIQVGILQ